MSAESPADAALRALADLVADVVAERVVERLRASGEDTGYYDQDTVPCGRRAYLRAARAGAFASSRVGKQVLAKKADVEAWIASRTRSRRPTANPAKRGPVPDVADSSDLPQILSKAGFELANDGPSVDAASRRRRR